MVGVRRESKAMVIDSKDLVPGDILLYEGEQFMFLRWLYLLDFQPILSSHLHPVFVNKGEKIPADGRLIKSNDLKVDISRLTGESRLVSIYTNS